MTSTKSLVLLFLIGFTSCYGEIIRWQQPPLKQALLHRKHDPAMAFYKYKNQLEYQNPFKNLKIDISDFVKFCLFTIDNFQDYQKIDPMDVSTLRNSHFNANKPTIFVVHGYMNNVDSEVIQGIKNSFMEVSDVNFIGVDWSLIAINLIYTVAADETGNVGRYLAQFADFLVENGAKKEDFHFIGHSLGAHVVGIAGANMKSGKIPRITGLDPARPDFENATPDERIDASDADFVDCIHTTAGGLGLEGPLCTVDFYPNGGLNPQPGCPWIDFGSCSHSRSHEYFAESILPNHQFPAFSCPKIPEDGPVDCNSTSFFMGQPATPQMKGIYYSSTQDAYPYAPTIKRKPGTPY